MTLQSLYKTIQDLKTLGHRIGFGRLLKRLIYSCHEEIVQAIDLKNVADFTLKNNLIVYPIERKHLDKLALFRRENGLGGENPSGILSEYLNNGFGGFMAELNGEIIGYIWWGDCKTNFGFNPRSYGFYAQQVPLTPKDTFGFDYFISPKYRKGGNSFEFMSKHFSMLKNLGFERNFGVVKKDNMPARWIYNVLGYKDIKKVKVQRFFLFLLFKNSKFFFHSRARNWLFDAGELPGSVDKSAHHEDQ